jgi:PTH1 family peptidyl-tRNA hydrolase
MNDSGLAVRPLAKRYLGAEPGEQLVIVHDELDLPPGTVRVKAGGGTAGHNGLRSIEAHLHRRDFLRVRIGIGKPPSPARGVDHVLKRPSKAEKDLLAVAVEIAADAVEVILAEGVDAAMNRFNNKS